MLCSLKAENKICLLHGCGAKSFLYLPAVCAFFCFEAAVFAFLFRKNKYTFS